MPKGQMETEGREALLYEKLTGSRVQCHTCLWRCRINPEKPGVCGMYYNREGVLYNLNYALASSVAADPIEKKPLFHFYPGTLAFSIGSWGCNFHCLDCQNWQISTVEVKYSQVIPPPTAIDLARNNHCDGIAWTYNEPSIWFEYTLDSAQLAKKNKLYTVYVTNGSLTPEALDTIGPYLDAWRVDIKGFTDTFYRHLAKVIHWQEILDVTRRAQNKWDMHVEVVTNVVPTMNDDDLQLKGIATWIRDQLGELTPWHVTRFFPHHQMADLPPTPISTLDHAVDIGHQVGLKFVYAGNVPGHKSENTVCYNCGQLNVKRFGYQTNVVGLSDSRCRYCGAELNFRSPGAGRRS